MSEMIESVAKAIHEARYDEPFCADKPIPWVMNAARAAIVAMRKPSEAMVDAANSASTSSPTGYWQSMISEALK